MCNILQFTDSCGGGDGEGSDNESGSDTGDGEEKNWMDELNWRKMHPERLHDELWFNIPLEVDLFYWHMITVHFK